MLFLLKTLKRLMRLKLRVNNQIMFCLFSNKNLIKSHYVYESEETIKRESYINFCINNQKLSLYILV